MRVRNWLFIVSVLLFVSGIGFIIAAERTRRSVDPARAAPSEVRAVPPVATVKQLMTGMIDPAARTVWESVSVTVSEAGTEEKQPKTDEEWASVATNAAMLVESATLLVQGPRAVDSGDWARLSRDMAEASTRALEAAEARKPEAILEVGEDIYKACTSCHEQYLRN
jgi:hypothetical protein